jgi:hypothetical protein
MPSRPEGADGRQLAVEMKDVSVISSIDRLAFVLDLQGWIHGVLRQIWPDVW